MPGMGGGGFKRFMEGFFDGADMFAGRRRYVPNESLIDAHARLNELSRTGYTAMTYSHGQEWIGREWFDDGANEPEAKHPTNCKNCGAPLAAAVCAYCETRYL